MIEPAKTPPSVAPPPPAAMRDADARRVIASQAAALARLLALVRRRAAMHRALAGTLAAFALAGGVLALGTVLVAWRQTWAREPAWVLAIVGLLTVLARTLWQARRLGTDDAAAARALGRASPGHASDLVSAVELARGIDAGEWSAALARAHIARMGTVASGLDARPALRRRPLAIAAVALAAAGAAHFAMAKSKGRWHAAWAYLAGRSTPAEAKMFAPDPIAGDIVLVYRYPDHMNRAPRTVAGTGGDIGAPKGTVVEPAARADRDTPRAVALLNATRVPLQVKGRVLSGNLLVTEPGEWKLRFETADGRRLAEGPPRPIVIEPDQLPEVKISSPPAEKEVDPDAAVTLEWSAGDDYGLLGVDLLCTLARGGTEARKTVASWKDVPRREKGELRWDLTPLKLEPGDRVTYYLEAKDNDTVSGPKTAVSESHVLKVFSQSEHNHEVLAKAEAVWERLLGGLADRLEEPPAGDSGEKADAAWMAVTQRRDESLSAVARDMKKLSAELADDERAPKEIGRALASVGARVATAVTRTTLFRRGFVQARNRGVARAFSGVLAAEIVEDEQGVLYLEDLLDRRRLLDLREMTRELERGRRALTDLARRYKQAPDEATRRALSGEVARLKERLHELFRRMQELAKGIQDEHLNREAMERIDEGGDLMSQLDEVQRKLSRGETDEALQALEELQKELAKMEKEFGESAGEADEQQKEVAKDLQKLASDLLDVEADQKAVKKDTDSLRQKAREEAMKKLEKLGRDFLRKQRDRVAKARKEMDALDPEVVQGLGLEADHLAVQERLEQLEQALKSGDLEEARSLAKDALLHAAALKLHLEVERDAARRIPGSTRDPPKLEAGAERTQRAEKPVREVSEDLEKLAQNLQQPAGEEERRQMQELSKRQGGVQKRTEELQKGFEEVGRKMPLFGPGTQKLLREAGGDMDEARQRLGKEDPRGAGSRQADALEKLGKLKDSMRESGEGGPGGIPMPFGAEPDERDGRDGDGRGFRAEKVEIPSADQSRAPAEFRKDLLDAMKDSTPESYRERVRDYYEELVK